MNNFVQPTVQGNGSGYIHLGYRNDSIIVIQPTDPNGYAADASWSNWGTHSKPGFYNNLGISGIRLIDCVALNSTQQIINHAILGGIDTLGFAFGGNPYARYLDFGTFSNPVQYIDHIRGSHATFFTCWLGNNDVLGYASNGGNTNDITVPLIGSISLTGLSDPNEFQQKYDSVLTAFHKIGAKGICATIPDVTSIPFFNTLTLSVIKGELGVSTVYIEQNNGTVRPMTDNDHVLLSTKDSIDIARHGESANNPIKNDEVLDVDETALAQSSTINFNNIIKNEANKFGFGVVDMYEYLGTLKSGITIDGVDYNVKYISGGAFGLDGIHLNPRGYALIANKFIGAINDTYGSNIPPVDVDSKRGVVFP